MALLCISYFIALSAGLTVVGLLIEHALPPSAARRWVWCAVIVASIFLPLVLAWSHTSSTIAVFGYELVRLSSVDSDVSPKSLSHNLLDCETMYGSYFNWMWLVSLTTLLVWGLANARRVSRVARPGDPSRTTIVDGVPVVVTDSVGPATVGVWRSRVVLPRWVLALPTSDRRYVVRHEEEHRTAHDTWLLCAMAVLASFFSWNFVLWYQIKRLRLAVELDCDNRVVSALGNADAYGELLFKVAEASSRAPRLQPAFLGTSGSLEKRLTALLNPAQRRRMVSIGAPMLAMAVLILILSVPHPARSGWLDGHSMKTHAPVAKN